MASTDPRTEFLKHAMSRRGFLSSMGAAGAAAFLAACGTRGATGTNLQAQGGGDSKTIVWANWTLYLDYDEESRTYPTLVAFEEDGVVVQTGNYSYYLDKRVEREARKKQWLAAHGFPVVPFLPARSAAEVQTAVSQLGGRCFVKSARGGYDGRSQCVVDDAAAALTAWRTLGEQPCLVESAVGLAHELSVLVARRPSGEQSVFPVALNHHEERVLRWSVMPAPESAIAAQLAAQARVLAMTLAEQLPIHGLLAVELFLTTQGELLVNELAARPHNTFHTTERVCSTSQFEQHVRAVCDLPLGDAAAVRPGAIINLLGDLWLAAQPPELAQALTVPTLRLHLYEKQLPRLGRKMGHLSALGDSSEQALQRVLLAHRLLQRKNLEGTHD